MNCSSWLERHSFISPKTDLQITRLVKPNRPYRLWAQRGPSLLLRHSCQRVIRSFLWKTTCSLMFGGGPSTGFLNKCLTLSFWKSLMLAGDGCWDLPEVMSSVSAFSLPWIHHDVCLECHCCLCELTYSAARKDTEAWTSWRSSH